MCQNNDRLDWHEELRRARNMEDDFGFLTFGHAWDAVRMLAHANDPNRPREADRQPLEDVSGGRKEVGPAKAASEPGETRGLIVCRESGRSRHEPAKTPARETSRARKDGEYIGGPLARPTRRRRSATSWRWQWNIREIFQPNRGRRLKRREFRRVVDSIPTR